MSHTKRLNAGKETIILLEEGKACVIGMTDYLVGVVSAEMPTDFEHDALKAQAVASRSYAKYCMASGKHDGGRLCTSSLCCQAYIDKDTMKSRWGADFEKNHRRILSAVNDTAGEHLSYNGEIVQTVFHSSSAGKTESSTQVWGAVDYLVSVSSPESSKDVPGYVSYARVSPEEFRSVILSSRPEAELSGDASRWIGEKTLTDSGRIESIIIGGVKITGRELRKSFSLRSTAFELAYSDGEFLFTVTGFGHGVGMSQYGANVMAQNGADYASILAHYYPGTYLEKAG